MNAIDQIHELGWTTKSSCGSLTSFTNGSVVIMQTVREWAMFDTETKERLFSFNTLSRAIQWAREHKNDDSE